LTFLAPSDSSLEIRITLESPQFAVKSWLPEKKAEVSVDPLN
jgi:hypothetical protein